MESDAVPRIADLRSLSNRELKLVIASHGSGDSPTALKAWLDLVRDALEARRRERDRDWALCAFAIARQYWELLESAPTFSLLFSAETAFEHNEDYAMAARCVEQAAKASLDLGCEDDAMALLMQAVRVENKHRALRRMA